jgi:RNA polymerase sigma factor (sigma-70 family)
VEERFTGILNNNKDAIYRICKAYATDEEHTRDLFQDVLLNIWRSLPGFKELSAVNTWVYRITLNVCIRAKHNADRHHQPVHLDSITWDYLPASNDEDNRHRYNELYACIYKLNEADKLLVLLFLEDLPYKDIAAVAGISENHVAVKLKRIKAKLFNCLNENGYDG